ncbi:Panacea domain-containing protein [Spiroplasma endosymbiont of Virgichneumon dumeticola]|uniref:Panacea domain-containing protein n=1 Tax=Spiroplasma endosymbiont of Virgichneumon dumeticola TaxID=3139323 RepID=UPI0035C881A2
MEFKAEELNDELFSITKYLIEKYKIMFSVKLQKVLYFLYLKYLKETGKKLFNDEFEAWVYGPVIPKIFNYIRENGFNFTEYYDNEKIWIIKNLDKDSKKEFIDNNIKKIIKFTTEELVNMSHDTEPFLKARNGLKDDIPSHNKLEFKKMKDFVKTWDIL